MLALVAHQGGWDEIGLVAAPVVVVAGLLALANRRAKAALAEQDTTDAGSPGGRADAGAGDNAGAGEVPNPTDGPPPASGA